MDPRRMPRAVSDPKVRHVGFFTPAAAPDLSQSGAPAATSSSPPFSDVSPSGTTLSPVMIPLPRHHSNDLPRHLPHAPPLPRVADTSIPVGSYNPSEFLSATSTEDFPDEPLSPGWTRGNGSGKFATSLPAGGFDMPLAKQNNGVRLPSDGGTNVEMQKEQKAVSGKTLKEKTTKAERRAMQEAQRAAKAAARGEGSKTSAAAASASGVNPANANIGKPVKAVSQKKDSSSVAASEKKGGDRQPDKDRKKDVPHPRMQFDDANRVEKAVSQKKDSSSVAASEKKGGDRQPDKDRKKDVPHPRMQFDDANRVEKAKKRSVVKQTEARNRVELFRHLPQYEHGTQLPDLESKFFQLDSIHPAVYNVGLRYLAADISGGNARCIAMLQAFQESMKDYSTPPQKSLIRDLTTKISGYVSFLTECRPLSISMGNAIRFLKTRIEELPLNLSESEAKANLIADIEHFISEKIILADKVIVKHAVTKIRDGDVLLTYASSSAVEMLLLHAHELGKQFRVVIVDSRPKLEGQKLLRRLVGKGINCTYTHINALSYIMHEVTRVFLGASSVLSNGTVYSRVGTACVAMVAHQFRVPVLICCEAYKFHIRVQLDSICSNELGDPDAISKVSGRKEINSLDGWANSENLQLLNLIYDATPSDYVSMIITDYGMIPPTSVPVIVREYQKDHLWIYS